MAHADTPLEKPLVWLVCLLTHLGLDKIDDIFKCNFLNENVRITIKISLKFVPNGPNSKDASIGSDNGLVPTRRQSII